MRTLLNFSGIAIAMGFVTFAPSASAQELTMTMTCQSIGNCPSRSEIAKAIRFRLAKSVVASMEVQLALTITDGKVTGATASGKGHWRMATGSAASLIGKSHAPTRQMSLARDNSRL